MARRYGIVILCLFLSVGLLGVQWAAGSSKPLKTTAKQKKHAPVKVKKAPRNLFLRSTSVLVKDQQTGEFLVQKQSDAVVPIASITKLMTAMVVLDARIDLKESITIEPEDIDTLLNSHSRLPVGTRLSRENALLLTLMASENRAAHALGRTYPGGLEAFVAAMNAKAKSLGLSKDAFRGYRRALKRQHLFRAGPCTDG